MEITGEIKFRVKDAKKIADSLSPDNLGFIECFEDGEFVTAEVKGESLRTMISTIDDYLMNLSVAERLSETVSEKFKNI